MTGMCSPGSMVRIQRPQSWSAPGYGTAPGSRRNRDGCRRSGSVGVSSFVNVGDPRNRSSTRDNAHQPTTETTVMVKIE